MPGNAIGGRKARDKNLAHDPDFYKHIGKAGGKKSRGGGFASHYVDKAGRTGPERAAIAGHKGGKKSWDGRRNRGLN